jgi:hypothetical protein
MAGMVRATAPTERPIWLSPQAYHGFSVLVFEGSVAETISGPLFLAPHELSTVPDEDRYLVFPVVAGEWTADYA